MLLPDLPDAFESPRLLLRAPRPEDAEVVNAAVVESFNEISPWLPWAKSRPSVEQTRLAMTELSQKFANREAFDLLLFSKAGDCFLGVSGIPRLDWSEKKFELGYWLRTSACGQGFATEAVVRTKTFAEEFLKPQRLEIRCDSRNTASSAVAERAGFRFERRILKDRVANDQSIQDTLIYSCLYG